MNKTDLKDVLDIVKEKLSHEAEAACGLFWPDSTPTSAYSVNEEDATTFYAVGEEDVTDRYGVAD